MRHQNVFELHCAAVRFTKYLKNGQEVCQFILFFFFPISIFNPCFAWRHEWMIQDPTQKVSSSPFVVIQQLCGSNITQFWSPPPSPHCVLKWVLRGHYLGIKMPQWNQNLSSFLSNFSSFLIPQANLSHTNNSVDV